MTPFQMEQFREATLTCCPFGYDFLRSNPKRDSLPQVAGPEDIPSREKHISQLLETAGLPPLPEIKKHYPDSEDYEMFYQ